MVSGGTGLNLFGPVAALVTTVMKFSAAPITGNMLTSWRLPVSQIELCSVGLTHFVWTVNAKS